MSRKSTHTLRSVLRRVFQSPARYPRPKSEDELPARTVRHLNQLGERLSAWVEAKQYCRPSPNLDDTIKQLGTDTQRLHLYFYLRVGEDFRTWRTRLRLQEAQRLFLENPSLTASEVSRITGFNDRSNFSRQFLTHMGMSVTDWRRKAGCAHKKRR